MWMFTDGGKSRKKNVSFLLILEIYIFYSSSTAFFPFKGRRGTW